MDQCIPSTKPCTRCRVELPFTAFAKHPNGRYGLQPMCRVCAKITSDARIAQRGGIAATTGTKVCSKCHDELPLEAFGANKWMRDGKRSVCRVCTGAQSKVYEATIPPAVHAAAARSQRNRSIEHYRKREQAWRDANRERVNAACARYRINHRERVIAASSVWNKANRARMTLAMAEWRDNNRERYLANVSAWTIKNRDRIRAKNAAYRLAHAERRRATSAAWERTHGHIRAEYNARRHAQKMHSSQIERINKATIIERDASICYLCGRTLTALEITLDHVIPLIAGGPHTYENLKVACRSCNSRKGGRLLPL